MTLSYSCKTSCCGYLSLQADMASEPKVADDGTLWTPGAVDFFRVVNTQVGILSAYPDMRPATFHGHPHFWHA